MIYETYWMYEKWALNFPTSLSVCLPLCLSLPPPPQDKLGPEKKVYFKIFHHACGQFSGSAWYIIVWFFFIYKSVNDVVDFIQEEACMHAAYEFRYTLNTFSKSLLQYLSNKQRF